MLLGFHTQWFAVLFSLSILAVACSDEATDGAGGSGDAGSSSADRGRRLRDTVEEHADPDRRDAGLEDGASADGSTEPDVSAGPDAIPDSSEQVEDLIVVEDPPTRSDDIPCSIETEAEGWFDGTWDGHVWGSHVLAGGDFDLLTEGVMSFEIFCQYDKLLIEGTMSGMAEGTYPFSSRLVGEFDQSTGQIEMDMVDASVMIMIIEVFFEAHLQGRLDGITFVDGTWEGESTSPTGAFGSGTWTATRR